MLLFLLRTRFTCLVSTSQTYATTITGCQSRSNQREHCLLIPASPYYAFCSLKCFCIVLPANFSSRAAQKLVIYMKVTPSYYRYQYAVYPNKFEAKNIFEKFLSQQRTVLRLIPLPPAAPSTCTGICS